MKYEHKFHTFYQGQGWNNAELAFLQLTDILSVAPLVHDQDNMPYP